MSRARRHTVFLSVLAILAAGSSAAAHHSYGAYDLKREIMVNGTIDVFRWASPHSLVQVRSEGKLYTFEWGGTSQMARLGVQRDTFKAGDAVAVTGNPRKDIDESGMANLVSIHRPSDRWRWDRWQRTAVRRP